MDTQEDTLRRWLAAPNTLRLLDKIARRVEKTLAAGRMNVAEITPRAPSGGRPSEISDRVDEIKAELVQYLLEKGAHFGPRVMAGEPGLKGHILRGFIHHLKDRVRNYTDDPYRYLYRRAREVLKEAADFYIANKSGRYLVFSLAPENVGALPLSEEELKNIAFPCDPQSRMDYKAICRQEPMRNLAAHFWRQASQDRPFGSTFVIS